MYSTICIYYLCHFQKYEWNISTMYVLGEPGSNPQSHFIHFGKNLPFVLLHILQRSRSQYYSSFIFIFKYLVRPNFSFGVIHHNKKCKKSIENIVLLWFLFAIPFYLMKGLPLFHWKYFFIFDYLVFLASLSPKSRFFLL